VGLSPEQTADLVATLAEAGVDFVKDDELMTNPASSPLRDRVRSVMRVINAHADKTGKRVMYAFNISDDIDTMLRNYDWIQENGGTCAMISINAVGLSATRTVCQHGDLAIHGHRNGWGMLNRHPLLGMDFAAYDKIWRLAGVDQLHVNGIDNKFWEPDDSVVHSIECCKRSFLGQPERPLPVVSSGQWGGQAFETYKRVSTVDLLYMAGGGIMAHPGGPAAGVRAIRQAWSSAVEGKSLQETASQHKDFRMAVEKFGKGD
jgi:ribulose-bisphosphate carboxylase large chain